MKPIRDKDLRLYQQVTNLDDDLILEAMTEPVTPPVRRARGQRAEAIQRFFAHPMVASLAVSTVILSVLVAVLLATGAFDTPTVIEPPAHGSYPEETYPSQLPQVPTAEGAASLHKGMSVADMEALLGKNYTVEDGQYTFTLDTGEKLTVSTSPDTSLVSGFIWQGETAKAVNPMNIPADILEKIQEYAADKVVPVYTMESLFTKYDRSDLPSIDEVLEGAEIRYLRMSADGRITVTDEEGHSADGALPTEGYELLQDLSVLFDTSVKVKAYYPILTPAEGGSVYFRTSIGDYVLYLHEAPSTASDQSAVIEPYLMPVNRFCLFSYVICREYGKVKDPATVQWEFSEKSLKLIDPYAILEEGYQKPVNLATPEAVEDENLLWSHEQTVAKLGTCLGCARKEYPLTYDDESGERIIRPVEPEGLHYWELTDGSGLILYRYEKYPFIPGQDPTSSSSAMLPTLFCTTMRTDSADVLDVLSTPTLATYELLGQEMTTCNPMKPGIPKPFVHAVLGDPLEGGHKDPAYSLWKWVENGETHTVTAYWDIDDYTVSFNDKNQSATNIEYSVMPLVEAAEEIELGMSFAAIVARVGNCICGHEVNSIGGASRVGYHYWELPDGRCLAVYMGYDIPAFTDPLGLNFEHHFNMTAMHLLYLDSPDRASTIGTPGLSMAAEVQTGMKEELVKALVGDPTVTVEGLQSVWEWSEGGKTYILTVYWKDNAPVGFHRNFNTVSRYELDAETSSAPLIPDKIPTLANAQVITEGMTASELLSIMGSRVHAVTGVGYTYYIWTLSDGQAFCAVTEDDVTNADQSERIVTYTYFRDSVEAMYVATTENMEAVTEGMSPATVYALLGTEAWDSEYDYPSSLTVTWGTSEGAWWEITVTFEAVEYPETNRSRAYAVSVYIDKGE